MKKYLLALSICLSAIACKQTNNNNSTEKKTQKPAGKIEKINLIKVNAPSRNFMISQNAPINIKLEKKKTESKIDSIKVYIDNVLIESKSGFTESLTISSANLSMGSHSLKIKAFSNDVSEIERSRIRIKSDITPKERNCRIINTYKHDVEAYTQGLQYEDGVLYESTGQYGKSSLRKTELKTGTVNQFMNLENKYFGEGMCIVDDKIIQITWYSQKGFIYEKESFRQIATFQYGTQGWGITYNGTHLIMSDGSNKLHFIETNTYSEVKSIEVYDDKGPVKNINELEYVDGVIYANIWQTDYLVTIDPNSGKILSKVNCSKLVPAQLRNHTDHVLNGIAYNSKSKNFYLTGKYWDKMYEVKISK